MVKIQSGRISLKIGSDWSDRHPDSNGVNGSPIQVRMEELEQVKFLVKVGLGPGLSVMKFDRHQDV